MQHLAEHVRRNQYYAAGTYTKATSVFHRVVTYFGVVRNNSFLVYDGFAYTAVLANDDIRQDYRILHKTAVIHHHTVE